MQCSDVVKSNFDIQLGSRVDDLVVFQEEARVVSRC